MAQGRHHLFEMTPEDDQPPHPAGSTGSGRYSGTPFIPDDATVGHILRESRLAAGYSVPDVAETLRIRRIFIEAMEDGRFGDLPGATYAHGFVRSYAELLELDAEDLVRRFKDEMSGFNKATQLVFPTPPPEGRMPGAAFLLIAVILFGLAYGSWYYASSTDRQLVDLLPDLPDRWTAWLSDDPADAALPEDAPTEPRRQPSVARAESAPVDPVEVEPESSPASAEPTAGAVEVPAAVVHRAEPGATVSEASAAEPMSPDLDPAATEPAATEPETADPEVAEALDGREPMTVASAPPAVDAEAEQPPRPPEAGLRAEAAEGDGRVIIRATDMSWVQVRDQNGRLVMTRVLQPGDAYEVPDGNGLRLDTGNAGALSIEVDGNRVPSLGRDGEVVRDVSLDAGALMRQVQ